ncbi:unnamed protein product [Larinioides sclopetarius]|uniref:WAP domain-containing protein n=1 Tax=Larinioides sclopetarius TaxID=280406 RepID=A0AAV1YT52_9ARAC
MQTLLSPEYCPKEHPVQCFLFRNNCCSDSDCSGGKLCCQSSCGNNCKTPVASLTNGKKANSHPDCIQNPFPK